VTGMLVVAARDNQVSPGVLGFLVVAALGVATWLLIRSMSRQMRKIDFDEDAVDRERPASAAEAPAEGNPPKGDASGGGA
jgi:hypothetical protein